jgi:4-amino-4-deoxy-L-arabinose transferase-like glycosyltransferase
LITRLININKPFQVLIVFCLLAVVLRFFSFFPSVIDHDESTYLEIARMHLEGKLLYVDMVDIKPPGIFVILSFFMAVFGYSIFVLRLLAALWIACTAFMLYKTAMLLLKDTKSSFSAGIIYIFMISTWSFYGISLTPEIFFNLFTICALYILLQKQNPLVYFAAGLVAGLGFLVKYFVLFDFAAFLLFLVIAAYRSEKGLNFKRVVFSNLLTGIGFIIPFAILNLIYYLNGHFDEFYNIVYLAPARYPSAFNAWKMLKFIMEFHLLFLPVFFMFYYVLSDKKGTGPAIQEVKLLAVTWVAFALVAVLIAGKTFGHYTIQLMLPVSLLAGLFFHSERKYPAFINPILSPKTGGIILAILIIAITFLKIEYYTRKDIPREIAAYLQPRLNEDDVIYAGNYHHILYYLLQKDSPTKYIHRTLLLKDTHIRALNIDTDEEFRKIMSAKPVYIITMKDYPAGTMKDYIMTNYILEKEFEGEIKLFRRTAE